MFTFDENNKYILLPPGTLFYAQDIYNAAMEWADDQDAMDADPPMRSTGYAALGGGAFTDKIFILQNGWKLKPANGTYICTIVGTLIALDENGQPYPRVVPPDSGQVQFVFQVSSQGIISVTGSGVTPQDKEDIANLVWQHTVGMDIEERTALLEKIESNRWKITNNQLIIYDDDGITPLKVFNLKDKEGQPSEENVFERVPA